MNKFELTLKIEMPTEMTDLPSIDVYKDGKLIEAHEGIYAEDLYSVIVGRCHLYNDIRIFNKEQFDSKGYSLSHMAMNVGKTIDIKQDKEIEFYD